jgi:hypothetical protein
MKAMRRGRDAHERNYEPLPTTARIPCDASLVPPSAPIGNGGLGESVESIIR